MNPWEPPIIVPVHNLGAGGNTPPYWLPPPRGLGWPHAMFNAFFLKRGMSPPSGVIPWVDSGGYLLVQTRERRLAGLHGKARERSYEADVEEVLKVQESFGASIAFTLDVPLEAKHQIEGELTPEVAERVITSARNAALAYQLRTKNSMKLFVVLQYNSKRALELYLDVLRAELRERAGMRLDEVDGFALGGLASVSRRIKLVTSRIALAKKLLGEDVWLHLLGTASPSTIEEYFKAGVNSMDSKTFIIAAAKRLYYLPPGGGKSRVKVSELDDLPCSCFVCVNHTAEDLRSNTKLLSLHNLHVLLEYAERARLNRNGGSRATKRVDV